MIEVGDYLYFYHSFGRSIDRAMIVRETKTQWILERDRRVNKGSLRSVGSSSWSQTYFYQETPELKEKYEVFGVWRKVLNKLDRIAEKRNHYIKERLTKERVNEIGVKVAELHDMLEELLPGDRK